MGFSFFLFFIYFTKDEFYYRFFTIPIVKCTFFLLRKIRFKKERFTIGIVKLPIVKRSVPFKSP
jgi:hypothetical protein